MRGGLRSHTNISRFTGICLNYSKQATENEVIVMVCLMEGGQTMAALMDGRWTKPGVRDSWLLGLESTHSLLRARSAAVLCFLREAEQGSCLDKPMEPTGPSVYAPL